MQSKDTILQISVQFLFENKIEQGYIDAECMSVRPSNRQLTHLSYSVWIHGKLHKSEVVTPGAFPSHLACTCQVQSIIFIIFHFHRDPHPQKQLWSWMDICSNTLRMHVQSAPSAVPCNVCLTQRSKNFHAFSPTTTFCASNGHRSTVKHLGIYIVIYTCTNLLCFVVVVVFVGFELVRCAALLSTGLIVRRLYTVTHNWQL